MRLTPDQQAMLDGAKGETLARVMKTLVMYGEPFGAEEMIPVTAEKRASGDQLWSFHDEAGV